MSRADQTALIYCPPTAASAASSRSWVWIAAAVILACAPAAWSQSDEDPLQDGKAVPNAQLHDEVLGGAFGVSPSGEIHGFFIPVKQRTSRDFGIPGDIKFHDETGDKTIGADQQPGRRTTKRYLKSRGGKFVAVVTRDRDKKSDSTDIFDLEGKRVANLPHHVVALSDNARFAALNGYNQVVEVASGKVIGLDVPADGDNRNLLFSEDSDAFTASYRRGRDAYVAMFTKDGTLKWRKTMATGVSPSVRNTVVSPSGDKVAVVAGELPIDHLSLCDEAGKVVWMKDIPTGNYAMSFTEDGSKLLLIYRDGHMLIKTADGAVLWKKPLPLPDIDAKGALLVTKVIRAGGNFIVASRSVLSTEPGKRPHETTSRVDGPDILYSIDEIGRIRMLMNRPNGTFLIESGRFHYEPVVTVDRSKIYYLTKNGVRTKAMR